MHCGRLPVRARLGLDPKETIWERKRGAGDEEKRSSSVDDANVSNGASAAPAAETRCGESLKTSAGVVKILPTGVSVQFEGQRLALFFDIFFFFLHW